MSQESLSKIIENVNITPIKPNLLGLSDKWFEDQINSIHIDSNGIMQICFSLSILLENKIDELRLICNRMNFNIQWPFGAPYPDVLPLPDGICVKNFDNNYYWGLNTNGNFYHCMKISGEKEKFYLNIDNNENISWIKSSCYIISSLFYCYKLYKNLGINNEKIYYQMLIKKFVGVNL